MSEMQKKILQGLGGKTEKTPDVEEESNGDLDFNDLEISFD